MRSSSQPVRPLFTNHPTAIGSPHLSGSLGVSPALGRASIGGATLVGVRPSGACGATIGGATIGGATIGSAEATRSMGATTRAASPPGIDLLSLDPLSLDPASSAVVPGPPSRVGVTGGAGDRAPSMRSQRLDCQLEAVPVDFLADPDGVWDYEGLADCAGFSANACRLAIGALTEAYAGFPEGAAVVTVDRGGATEMVLVDCVSALPAGPEPAFAAGADCASESSADCASDLGETGSHGEVGAWRDSGRRDSGRHGRRAGWLERRRAAAERADGAALPALPGFPQDCGEVCG